MNLVRPIVVGLHGTELTPTEQKWLPQLMPYGVILFSRNIESKTQVKALTNQVIEKIGSDAVVLVDQEGGRVQRLKSPKWPDLPSALQIGKLWRVNQFAGLEAANLLGQVIGSTLAELRITHTCAPVIDLLHSEADPVIGDRAFGVTPAEVIPLATSFLNGLNQSGVTGILKHIPGMGRVTKDSHNTLPVIGCSTEILSQSDWLPFKAVSGTHWAMTAHVVISGWDSEPVTTSALSVLRIKELIGNYFLISDCLTMGAIQGSIETRVRKTLDAGVNLALFSNGSDAERCSAVFAAGEPRLFRDDSKVLHSLSSEQMDIRLQKLSSHLTAQKKTEDPTRDQSSQQ
jgi:beta-N-acetylhexosaminidase|tara:strand:+ start:6393 stop:7424 length:1032 start_codon:yes stop_codon:yes gene_type:complete